MILEIVFWVLTGLFALFSLSFLITFFLERNYHALMRGAAIFLPIFALLLAVAVLKFPAKLKLEILTIIDSLAFIFGIMMFIKIPASPMNISPDSQKQISEKDAFFHRFYYLKPGSKEFEIYYQKEKPEKKEIDDAIRKLPNLGEPGSRGYHPINSLYQWATFDIISRINRPAYFPSDKKTDLNSGLSPEEFTRRIKGYARYLGADLVGIAKLNQAYVYSHTARGEGKWGEPVKLNHNFAIVVACEMKSEMIRQAPQVAVTTESSLRYMDTAKISLILARFISLLGYDARAHIDGNYQVMCIPIAVDAGLGELGRHGLLITPKFGSRVRLSVVTTNLPLKIDQPRTFGVQQFCDICKKCARNCPSSSIEKNGKKWVNGVEKWQSQQDSCYRFWRLQGSDCSVCINECPYSYPNSLMHNIIRFFVKRNNFARYLIYRGDRIFYGKKLKSHVPPPEWHS